MYSTHTQEKIKQLKARIKSSRIWSFDTLFDDDQ
jgi:hypothetical protein